MTPPTWAGGAKLKWGDVQRLRARKHFTREDAGTVAERLGVNKETVWRAYKGISWSTVRHQRLPEEYKRCAVCRKRFGRRFPGGRHRSDAFWQQKQTCDRSCYARLNWARGVYGAR